MCKAFSCLVTKSGKCYWKFTEDSHDNLQHEFSKVDKEIIDDKEAPNNTFARVEIAPQNGNYVKPNKWVFKIDEQVKPCWITIKHEKIAWKAHSEWKKKLYTIFRPNKFPKNPFTIPPPKKITPKVLRLILEWDSVRDSVWDSVGGSVGGSVGDSVGVSVGDSVWVSVRDSVWDSVGVSVRDSVGVSVGDSVWGSVRDSVWGSVGDMFEIKDWKYVDRSKEPFESIKGYPFKSSVKLWKIGLVPLFDGKVWRLHGGKKAEILWKGTVEDIKKEIRSGI